MGKMEEYIKRPGCQLLIATNRVWGTLVSGNDGVRRSMDTPHSENHAYNNGFAPTPPSRPTWIRTLPSAPLTPNYPQ